MLKDYIITVEMGPGDVLFIPDGWWHEVSSEKCSMALNFWFHSPLFHFLSAPHMLPHILRSTFFKMVSNEVAADSGLRGSSAKRQTVSSLHINANDHQHLKAYSPPFAADFTDETFYNFVNELLHLHDRQSLLRSAGSAGNSSKESESTNSHTALMERIRDAEEVFVSTPFHAMKRLWPVFARRHSDKWVALLLSLSPPATYRLTAFWDSLSGGAADHDDNDDPARGDAHRCSNLTSQLILTQAKVNSTF
jgi:hypothetical protein